MMRNVKIAMLTLLVNTALATALAQEQDARATTGDPREFFVVNKTLHYDVVELRKDRNVNLSDFWSYKPERPANVPNNAVLVTVVQRNHTQAQYVMIGWAWMSKEAVDILHGISAGK